MAALVLVGAIIVDRFVEPIGIMAWVLVGTGVAFAVLVSLSVTLWARTKTRGHHGHAR